MLFRRSWLPKTSARIVILVHGYGEHSGRYERTASDLARAGFEVHAYDHQGHGRSGGTRCYVRRFDQLLDDLEGFIAAVRAERPPLPVVVVGHSMGGLIVAAYASQRNPDVAGVATSAAALAISRDVSRLRAMAAHVLKWLAPRLSLASELDPDGLSRDPEVVRAYLEDPLVQRKITASLASEMLSAMKRTAASAAGVTVPMLLQHGEGDPICPVEGSRDFFEQLTATRRKLCTYPELRHEIFNEPERAAVLGDLVGWIRELG
ncbi:MAG: lysophospholipase [Deltaproteobacteria bacterium]|nr:lysophospholipase [Deltaproteobacteria bacterium]MBW2542995.1 lysophospholipase [Deltaproteobacteria bacterium]